MIELRDYQQEAVEAIREHFRSRSGSRGTVCALPTGAGKSLVIGGLIRHVLSKVPDARVLCLTHLKELLVQNSNQLARLLPGVDVGLYSAGLRSREVRQVTFAGIMSIARKLGHFERLDLVIIDECHLVPRATSTTYRQFLDRANVVFPRLRTVGFTATPFRTAEGCITGNGVFDNVCFSMCTVDGFNRLLDDGYLCPLVPVATTEQLDVRGAKLVAGDFAKHAFDEQLAGKMPDIVDETIRRGQDRKCWLAFTPNVTYAEAMANAFNSRGVPTKAVHGKMSVAERDAAIDGLRCGQLRCLTSVNVLSTGVDIPQIDLIVGARPTASPVMWVQMLGRGLRPAPGKENCLVLDFAWNSVRLGPINDPRIRQKGEKLTPGLPPMRRCPECDTFVSASLLQCPQCQFVFPRQGPDAKLKRKAATAALIKRHDVSVERVTLSRMTVAYHTSKKGVACACVDFDLAPPAIDRLRFYFALSPFWLHQSFRRTMGELLGEDTADEVADFLLEQEEGSLRVPVPGAVIAVEFGGRFPRFLRVVAPAEKKMHKFVAGVTG